MVEEYTCIRGHLHCSSIELVQTDYEMFVLYKFIFHFLQVICVYLDPYLYCALSRTVSVEQSDEEQKHITVELQWLEH